MEVAVWNGRLGFCIVKRATRDFASLYWMTALAMVRDFLSMDRVPVRVYGSVGVMVLERSVMVRERCVVQRRNSASVMKRLP